MSMNNYYHQHQSKAPTSLLHRLALTFDFVGNSSSKYCHQSMMSSNNNAPSRNEYAQEEEEEEENVLSLASQLVADRDERSPILSLIRHGKFLTTSEMTILFSVDGSSVRAKRRTTFSSLHESPLTLQEHHEEKTADNNNQNNSFTTSSAAIDRSSLNVQNSSTVSVNDISRISHNNNNNNTSHNVSILPLQDLTKRQHDAAARMGGRNVRYVVLYKKCRNGAPSLSHGFASAADLDVVATEEAMKQTQSLRLFRRDEGGRNKKQRNEKAKQEESEEAQQNQEEKEEQEEEQSNHSSELESDLAEDTLLHIQHVDSARCQITGPPVVRLLCRPSVAIESIDKCAKELSENPALVSTATIERCVVQSCGWVADTMRLIDEKWTQTVKETRYALNCAQQPLATQPDRAGIKGGLALNLVEGFLKRHGALQGLETKLLDPSGPFVRILAKTDPASEVSQQWTMRMARLTSELELARSEAACVSVLSPPLLAIKWHRVQTSPRGIDALRDVADKLGLQLFLATSILDKSLDRDEADRRVTTSFFTQLLLPAIASDLISAVERALMLENIFAETKPGTAEREPNASSAAFSANTSSSSDMYYLLASRNKNSSTTESGTIVEKAANDNEEEGQEENDEENNQSMISLEKRAPLAASAAIRARFVESAAVLRGWAASYRRVGLALHHPCYALQRRWISVVAGRNNNNNNNSDSNDDPEKVWCLSEFETSPVHDALYAADRCDDLYKFLGQIERAGLGLQTPQVRCLYATLHQASGIFPMLRAGQHRNWSVIAEKFDRTLTLQYTALDKKTKYSDLPLIDEEEEAAEAERQRKKKEEEEQDSLHHHHSPSGSPSTTKTTTVLETEHSILSLRVAQLTEELKETRHTLKTSSADVRSLKDSLTQALSDNQTLRENLNSALLELGKMRAMVGGPSSSNNIHDGRNVEEYNNENEIENSDVAIVNEKEGVEEKITSARNNDDGEE